MICQCESCGKKFKRQRGSRGRFCSRKCWGLEMSRNNPQKISGPDDFWKRIIILNKNDCWEWTGCKNKQGYGQLMYQCNAWLSHRLAFFLTHLKLPECVCHHCDNPACCNPSHMFDGDRAANNADRHAKGRSRGGSLPGKLNPMFGKRRLALERVR